MNVSQALELAASFFIPEFLLADGISAVESERLKTEEAIKVLRDDWFAQPKGAESFSFDVVRELADRNRTLCDLVETSDSADAQALAKRRAESNSPNLARGMSEGDLIQGVAALQRRSVKKVAREVGGVLDNLAVVYVAAPVKGTVVGIDLETTGRNPDRSYIINIGWETMELTADAQPQDGRAVYCGMPAAWSGRSIPMEHIHHITPEMLKDKTPLREDKALQKELVALLSKHPFMAHNASFEDSWMMLHLEGYAEARKAGKIVPIDTRDICRRIDKDMVGLPRESHPASLENWARRRGTLDTHEAEKHLGLDDTDLMLRTVQAEFALRHMFVDSAGSPNAPTSDTSKQGKNTSQNAPARNAQTSTAEKDASTAATKAPTSAGATQATPTQTQAAQASGSDFSPELKAAGEKLAHSLKAPLARVATGGAVELAQWSAAWLAEASQQLPEELKTHVHIGEATQGDFVASIDGTDTTNPQIFQARLSVVDQSDLARGLAHFALLLAQTSATQQLPARSVALACFS